MKKFTVLKTVASNTNLPKVLGAVFSLSLITACSQTHQYHTITEPNTTTSEIIISHNDLSLPPPLYADGFKPIPLDIIDIFSLLPRQQQLFTEYLQEQHQQQQLTYKATADYLESIAYSFDYQSNTYKAQDGFEQRQGNCLSLVILSSALAKVAGLEHSFKLVHSAPTHHQNDGLEFISSHVNITIYDNPSAKTNTILRPASVTIDYFRDGDSVTSEVISENDIRILYWQNRAGEALKNKDYDLAFAYTSKATEIDAKHPETLNLLAILYRKIGREEQAIEIYKYAMKHKIYSYTLIDNYAHILEKNGLYKEAADMFLKVEEVNETNPYVWLELGRKSLNGGQYVKAQRFFKQSAKLGPYLYEPKYLLAMSHMKLGNNKQALQAMIEARAIAHLPADRQRFSAKITTLKQHQQRM